MTSISKMALASALCGGVAFALGFVILLALYGVVDVDESFLSWTPTGLAVVMGVSAWALGLVALSRPGMRSEERRGRTLARIGTHLGEFTTLVLCLFVAVAVFTTGR